MNLHQHLIVYILCFLVIDFCESASTTTYNVEDFQCGQAVVKMNDNTNVLLTYSGGSIPLCPQIGFIGESNRDKFQICMKSLLYEDPNCAVTLELRIRSKVANPSRLFTCNNKPYKQLCAGEDEYLYLDLISSSSNRKENTTIKLKVEAFMTYQYGGWLAGLIGGVLIGVSLMALVLGMLMKQICRHAVKLKNSNQDMSQTRNKKTLSYQVVHTIGRSIPTLTYPLRPEFPADPLQETEIGNVSYLNEETMQVENQSLHHLCRSQSFPSYSTTAADDNARGTNFPSYPTTATEFKTKETFPSPGTEEKTHNIFDASSFANKQEVKKQVKFIPSYSVSETEETEEKDHANACIPSFANPRTEEKIHTKMLPARGVMFSQRISVLPLGSKLPPSSKRFKYQSNLEFLN